MFVQQTLVVQEPLPSGMRGIEPARLSLGFRIEAVKELDRKGLRIWTYRGTARPHRFKRTCPDPVLQLLASSSDPRGARLHGLIPSPSLNPGLFIQYTCSRRNSSRETMGPQSQKNFPQWWAGAKALLLECRETVSGFGLRALR